MKSEPLASLTAGLLLVLGAAGACAGPAWAATDAKALIRHAETQYQGRTAHAVFRMKVVTASWSREMAMESWSQGREKMLAKILSPKKDAGTATLKVGAEMWNYLPKIDRLMKIPTSLMGDRWMGSHLTNDDLVKENKVDELYTFKVERETASEAVVGATPKPDAAVVWGRIVYVLDLVRQVPASVEYFDEDGERVRTVTFADVRRVAGRWIPMRIKFVPADAPGEYTEMAYEHLEFDKPLPEGMFSVRHLRR